MHHHHHDHQEGANTPALPCLDLARLAPLGAAGAAPAGLTHPTNDDAPGWRAKGIKGQKEAVSLDCDGARSTDQARTEKRCKTLRARLALSRSHASDGAVIYAASRKRRVLYGQIARALIAVCVLVLATKAAELAVPPHKSCGVSA